MKWINEQDIEVFLNRTDYDIRKTGSARWIDQKCTPDVITIVADCIIHYVNKSLSLSSEENVTKVADSILCYASEDPVFSSVDIWHNEYTVVNVESFFKKPNLDEKKARNEYDKFFQQPMEMLAYAGVLQKHKIKNRNFYSVKNIELLNFIALREKNALVFLKLYIKKVLNDSEIWNIFEVFLKKQDAQTYADLKIKFSGFIIKHTPIKGQTECFRIFTKVLNPLAYTYNIKGTEKGRLSKHKVTYDMLMYNRDNFRDIYANKPKELTRTEYAEQQGISLTSTYTKYLSQKAKRVIRTFNDTYRNGLTEVADTNHSQDVATNIHHIFPEAAYPQISAVLENLIALTPTQHYNYAHPLGNTQIVDESFQHLCLISKIHSIQSNLNNDKEETIYDFDKLIFVLAEGFADTIFYQIDHGDFTRLIEHINLKYN